MPPHPSSIVILTGAGISAESGVSTFRDPEGIWSKNDWREVATPQGFSADPDRVHAFYNERRRRLETVAPNAAHHALARLERAFGGNFLLVTQNVDDLHERAGSRQLIHMHGQHTKAWCTNCGTRMRWNGDLLRSTPCPSCESAGYLRPDIVWFGEMPYQMDRIVHALRSCDLFISIGTSGNVYPAAGFVEEARLAGARRLELNLEPSEGASRFTEANYGKATEIVPAFVDRLLGA
jgi:NAD-dependent deacetylase